MADTGKKNDLFSSSMSLGDHLEELRTRIIFALVGFVLVVAVCMFFGKFIIAFIEAWFKISHELHRSVSKSETEGSPRF